MDEDNEPVSDKHISVHLQFKYYVSNLKIILTTESASLVTEMIHIGYYYGKNFPWYLFHFFLTLPLLSYSYVII